MASEKKEGTLAKLRGPSKKVAIVTGGCGGIGSAICRYLADDGMHVVVVDLNQSQCEKMAASLATKSMGLSINICDEKAVAEGVKKVLDKLYGECVGERRRYPIEQQNSRDVDVGVEQSHGCECHGNVFDDKVCCSSHD